MICKVIAFEVFGNWEWFFAEPKRSYQTMCKYDTIKENRKRLQGWLMKKYKIIVGKHTDGYVAYPLGLRGVVVGQGETYEEALSDVKSAIRIHMESFGEDVLEVDPSIIEAFIAEAGV